MRFMDELRGSEGESCTVADLWIGKTWIGTIESLEEPDKVIVRDAYDRLFRVGYSLVTVKGENES